MQYPSHHHPSTRAAPHAAIWRRGTRQDLGDIPRAHAELVVLLGLHGTARYLLDETVVDVSPGTLIWAAAGSAHMLIETSADFDMWVVVAHPKLWTKAALVPMSDGTGERRLHPDAVSELHDLATTLIDSADAIRAVGLRWWLIRAQHHWTAARDRQTKKWHPAVARAALVIDADPSKSVEQIANGSGLSPGQLGRVFREQTGHGIAEFRNERRLAAVDRAVATGQPLLNAALDAGFGSYSQFFRVFRARRKTSPRDWYVSHPT